ncbi:K/H antiporter 1 [Gloeophyllum trabeum ATCC 11539]|uniref:K/H antiporter 1 n=1 Tax=Gloeophyllum trabeum (strain ATCC 11539 / FP-39264 / Madison 617) TaxID=670483 RepID=S7QH14_GLOTA|nr:K/H antiporter 1 [Gloeophyllum trabeum ATCC 11539]EPQ58503.1 K/H antiporter 1 [Gloeophyllum trabeum ATCC 11539]
MASLTSASAAATSTQRAPSQAGIIDGSNPTVYNPKDPITIFIIQAGIIIIFCRLLHWPLAKLRQPRVIAEVIGGILLGPSVMGRIPHFTSTIFPPASMPNLTLVANLGLVLFLFLVGLEVDLRVLVSNWRVALSVGLASMALPFGLGAAISYGLYHQFRMEADIKPTSFGVYCLFIAVAMSITAFPVLCRILTELKLLMTPVGVIVLSAGVGNDVVGWILLALCVALVNAGSGLTALWVLLICIGYTLFLAYAVRPAFLWLLRRTRTLQDGPSQGIIVLTLLMVLTSAFFTGVIGVHPIFGAFMIGLICPHEGGFAIKVTEKVEDIVSSLFLPLYFAYSGLNTNLGLLDNGITWAYVIGVTAVAFCAKFTGAGLAARANGLVWRECFAIGALMSCKGLVELIVLNIGLQAQILSQTTFTIFVVMALITTFVTTPLTSWLYPPHYRRKLEAWRRNEIDWETGAPINGHDADSEVAVPYEKLQGGKVERLLVYLRLDNMSALLPFVSLFGGKSDHSYTKVHPSRAGTVGNEVTSSDQHRRPVAIKAHGVRLLELTDRDSSVMKVSEVDSVGARDPVVGTFRTFGYLNNLAVSGEVDVVPENSFSDVLVSRAADVSADLIILPWSETGSMSESAVISGDALRHKLSSDNYNSFVASVLDKANCSTAVFVNEDFGGSGTVDRRKLQRSISHASLRSTRDQGISAVAPSASPNHHIFLPFFGGADDRAALRLVLQLAENPYVMATIVYFATPEEHGDSSSSAVEYLPSLGHSGIVPTGEATATFFDSVRNAVPGDLAARVLFDRAQTSTPLSAAIEYARKEVGRNSRNAGDLVVIGRNLSSVAMFAQEDVAGESNVEAQRCLGVVAEVMVRSKVKASLLVVQAGRSSGGQ